LLGKVAERIATLRASQIWRSSTLDKTRCRILPLAGALISIIGRGGGMICSTTAQVNSLRNALWASIAADHYGLRPL
jgi:hypothetical protein